MMRALWTAGLGMTGQQMNVDVIANNLANVNTTGYKKQRVEFKDLIYEKINSAYSYNGEGKPVNLQVGHGAYPVATVKSFTPGNFDKTENPLDLVIDGPAFFTFKGAQGTPVYSKDGSFKLSVSDEGTKLVSSQGDPVLDDSGSEIFLTVDATKLSVSSSGELMYLDENGTPQSMGQKLGLVSFINPAGMESLGNNMLAATSASGQPISQDESPIKSTVQQGFLESSNVQVVEEMVKLIMAQRAYEINSKSIQSADEMLGMANNLRRG
ncbi:MAG: flagellar hook-basal body protein [Deltaproteobacteria bacterium]